ncbi:MAG TPA: TetR/AcrR family transcriptional regulator [Phycisphaerae bacterium]|nr:TetR/AcrR family transcriptional regulator [Phycisphaerae bacterium]
MPATTRSRAREDDLLPVRDRLLDAAERLAGRSGLQNFTLEAVANEAGVSKGGLLYHFPSKSALITAIVQRLADRCEADQQAALAEAPNCPGAFARAYVAVRTDPLDPGELRVHAALLAAAGTDPRFLDPFREKMAGWQARLEADGIEPEVALIVRLAIDGMCLCGLLGMPLPTGELRSRVIERLMAMTQPAEPLNKQENSQ